MARRPPRGPSSLDQNPITIHHPMPLVRPSPEPEKEGRHRSVRQQLGSDPPWDMQFEVTPLPPPLTAWFRSLICLATMMPRIRFATTMIPTIQAMNDTALRVWRMYVCSMVSFGRVGTAA